MCIRDSIRSILRVNKLYISAKASCQHQQLVSDTSSPQPQFYFSTVKTQYSWLTPKILNFISYILRYDDVNISYQCLLSQWNGMLNCRTVSDSRTFFNDTLCVKKRGIYWEGDQCKNINIIATFMKPVWWFNGHTLNNIQILQENTNRYLWRKYIYESQKVEAKK